MIFFSRSPEAEPAPTQAGPVQPPPLPQPTAGTGLEKLQCAPVPCLKKPLSGDRSPTAVLDIQPSPLPGHSKAVVPAAGPPPLQYDLDNPFHPPQTPHVPKATTGTSLPGEHVPVTDNHDHPLHQAAGTTAKAKVLNA